MRMITLAIKFIGRRPFEDVLKVVRSATLSSTKDLRSFAQAHRPCTNAPPAPRSSQPSGGRSISSPWTSWKNAIFISNGCVVLLSSIRRRYLPILVGRSNLFSGAVFVGREMERIAIERTRSPFSRCSPRIFDNGDIELELLMLDKINWSTSSSLLARDVKNGAISATSSSSCGMKTDFVPINLKSWIRRGKMYSVSPIFQHTNFIHRCCIPPIVFL
mmetsp:Transcript_41979/g.46888  ORF Transcript_41979/g.46888 Transcript_41979/m.46888 type:complete len:217 (+) Transcript_41979:200-850(+)